MPATIDAPYGGGCAEQTANIDVLRIVEKMDRVAEEAALCQSSDMNGGLLPPDHTRIVASLADFKAYLDYAVSQPVPDTPETHGRVRDTVPLVRLKEGAESDWRKITVIENGDIKNILRQMRAYRIEVSNCQSGRLVQGFLDFDKARMNDGFQRILDLVAYGAVHEPSDMPESTPAFPATESGH